MTLPKDLVAASAQPLILSILSHGESYGYEILQKVRELSEGGIRWTDGMLYPVLHRLERAGLIESEWRPAETGRRRKYYTVTEAGREALEQGRRDWMRVHSTLVRLWEDPA